jgi:hypothetical protein
VKKDLRPGEVALLDAIRSGGGDSEWADFRVSAQVNCVYETGTSIGPNGSRLRSAVGCGHWVRPTQSPSPASP